MGSEITANQLLAMLGGIIVAGFLANLTFKVYKIPSVVKLMILGLILGPILKLPADQLMDAAPYFGQVALLIILFAGGMRLQIETVIAQLRNAVLLAVVAFVGTLSICMPISIYIMGYGLMQSFIFSTLMAGTASSIVIPVVTKLSVKDSLKTLLSIESALSNLLILVVVIVACDIHISDPNIGTILYSFFLKIFVSLASAVVAGIIWSRLIGSMKGEPYSYMLTLGFIFLLNYIVDWMGGSGAISILFFGIVLANVSTILSLTGERLNKFIGVELDVTKFSLDEFVKGISGELSFLVATFFFVFLGMLVDFKALTSPEVIKNIALIITGIIVGRVLMVQLFSKLNKRKFTIAETLILIAMMPRGLATAVMAFKPSEAPYNIPGTEDFPFYAMFAILGTNVIMAIIVKAGESRLKKEGMFGVESIVEAVTQNANLTIQNQPLVETVQSSPAIQETHSAPIKEKKNPSPHVDDDSFTENLTGFNRLLFRSLGIRNASFIKYVERAVRSLFIRDSIYWLKIGIVMIISVFGLMMNKPEIVLAAMLLFPMLEIINTTAISIVTGDVYIFLRANLKILLTFFAIVLLTFLLSAIAPFTGITDEIRAQTEPTVLNFILSIAVGGIIPIMVLRGNKLENLAIAPILGILIIPPLSTIGFALGTGMTSNFFSPVFLGGLLSFATNYSCVIIGAVVSQFVLGLSYQASPEAVAYISDWHEKEVEREDLHNLFERLHLTRLFERVGTPIGRAIVMGVLMLAIYIPLQLAVNDIQKDYEFKEIMHVMSQEYFEIKDQSSVLSQTVEYHKDLINVKIWVSTSQKIKKDRVRAFEEELEKRIGIPVTFSLIQSFTDFGEEATMSTLPTATGEEPKILSEQLSGMKEKLSKTLSALPELNEMLFTDIYAGVSGETDSPHITLEVFSLNKISPDMKALLKERVSGELEMGNFNFGLNELPSTIVIENFENMILEKSNKLNLAGEIADRLPSVKARITAPKGYDLTDFNEILSSAQPALINPEKFRITEGTDNTLTIEFY